MERKRITIVLPAFNEQDNIQLVYNTLQPILAPFENRYDWELLFVDDGSSDNTRNEIKKLRKEHPEHILYVFFSRNFGKEYAVLAGLDHANGDAVIIMDADLQHPPEKIPEMIALFEQGYDDVFGLKTNRGKESLLKKLFVKIFYGILSRKANHALIPNVGDFRLLSKRAVEAFRLYRETNRYNKGYFALIGFNKTPLPYEVAERQSGETKWSTWKLFRFAMDGLTGFSTSMLRISTLLGAFFAFVSFLIGFIEIFSFIWRGSVPGYPSLITTITFLGGIQLLSIGILGEYIARIYTEQQKRPLYLVQDCMTNAANKNSTTEKHKFISIDFCCHPELIHGARRIEKDADGKTVFSRTTPQMYNAFQPGQNPTFWNYMLTCTAGIRISFRSRAKSFRMVLAYDEPLDSSCYFGETDVRINDGPFKTFRADLVNPENKERLHDFTCELGDPSEERKIEIYLPNQIPARLVSFELDSDILPEPVKYNPSHNILFVGDSITQGYFTSPADCYAARYADADKAEFTNVSVGGATLSPQKAIAAMAYPWTELVMAFGTNDLNWRKLEDFKNDAIEFLTTVTKRENTTITVIAPIPIIESGKNEERQNKLILFRTALKEVCEQFPGVRFANGAELVDAIPDNFAPDGVHPFPKGMKQYADKLIRKFL